MSKWLLDGLKECFGPDVPRWACELTSQYVVAVQAGTDRQTLLSHAVVELPSGALIGDGREANLVDFPRVREALSRALEKAGFSGSDIVMVVPDGVARVSILQAESFPDDTAHQQSFIRWKLKKNIPFDIETARLAYKTLGQNGSGDVLVALSPKGVTRQYEDLVESIGLHAGILSLSTLASLNLINSDLLDKLFVKVSPDSVTTSLFVEGHLKFYRKVGPQALYDAVYPTVMYYEDKLEGGGVQELVTCFHDAEAASGSGELAMRLSIPERSLHLEDMNDIYKPALGAVQV